MLKKQTSCTASDQIYTAEMLVDNMRCSVLTNKSNQTADSVVNVTVDKRYNCIVRLTHTFAFQVNNKWLQLISVMYLHYCVKIMWEIIILKILVIFI